MGDRHSDPVDAVQPQRGRVRRSLVPLVRGGLLKSSALLTFAVPVSLATGCAFPQEDPLNVASTRWVMGAVGNAAVHVTFGNDGNEKVTLFHADAMRSLMNETGLPPPPGRRVGGKTFDAEGREFEQLHNLVHEGVELAPRSEWNISLGFSFPNAHPSDFLDPYVVVRYKAENRSYRLTTYLPCVDWLGHELPHDRAQVEWRGLSCGYTRR